MADHSGEVVSGEANQQAFATSRTTDQLAEDDQDIPPGRGGLVLAALGVVFGDIGTSPVYTFRECFNPEHGLALTQANVLGVLSCLIWALLLVVAVKYVLLIMRADNQGEGGSGLFSSFSEKAAKVRFRGRFSQATFIGTRGNERDAPEPEPACSHNGVNSGAPGRKSDSEPRRQTTRSDGTPFEEITGASAR